MPITVLLIDGRKLLREGLCALLDKHADIKVVGEADEGAAAVKLVRAVPADVVILNVMLTPRGSIDLIRQITATRERMRLLVHTAHPSTNFVRDILRAGASGCLTKDSASNELVAAIRTVAGGKMYLSPGLADAVVKGYVNAPEREAEHAPLSPREREVLQRIADGETTKEIARALRVSGKTVETHRRRLMEKL